MNRKTNLKFESSRIEKIIRKNEEQINSLIDKIVHNPRNDNLSQRIFELEKVNENLKAKWIVKQKSMLDLTIAEIMVKIESVHANIDLTDKDKLAKFEEINGKITEIKDKINWLN